MPLIISIAVFLASEILASGSEVTHNKLTVYSFPSQVSEVTTWAKTHDILKDPLIVFAKTNPENEDFEAYFAADGLSSMPTDKKGRKVYESLRSEDTAVMLLPNYRTPSELETYENSELAANLREPGLLSLGLMLASAVGIPWLLSGSNSKENATTTTTTPSTKIYGQHGLETVYYLELSDQQVTVLENLYSLPRGLNKEH